MTPMDRRRAMTLFGAGLGAGMLRFRLDAAQPLQFLTPAEDRLVDALTEAILPADAHSPGAHEALVSRYIDLLLANSPAREQAEWREQLAAFEAFAGQHGGVAAAVPLLAAKAANPTTPAERFFARARSMTIFAYYSSETGLIKELEYKGNQVMGALPGCPPAH